MRGEGGSDGFACLGMFVEDEMGVTESSLDLLCDSVAVLKGARFDEKELCSLGYCESFVLRRSRLGMS